MMIIDAHCHVALFWYEPVESLLFQMDRTGVTGAVLIQMNDQVDNCYQSDATHAFPGRFSSVVAVHAHDPTAPQTLAYLAEQGASGVRWAAATAISGDLAVWRMASDFGLAVSCGGSSAEFSSPEFARAVQALPRLPIVLEHLGGHDQPGSDSLEDRRAAFELARFPNVYIKVHGLGEFCGRRLPVTDPFPFVRPVPPLFDMAYKAFRPARIMWGSDYPPVSAREGYANALRLAIEQFDSKGQEARALIFGQVAREVFPTRT
jgi:L-fuconolactonase